jgi:hypothetical protein
LFDYQRLRSKALVNTLVVHIFFSAINKTRRLPLLLLLPLLLRRGLLLLLLLLLQMA